MRDKRRLVTFCPRARTKAHTHLDQGLYMCRPGIEPATFGYRMKLSRAEPPGQPLRALSQPHLLNARNEVATSPVKTFSPDTTLHPVLRELLR